MPLLPPTWFASPPSRRCHPPWYSECGLVQVSLTYMLVIDVVKPSEWKTVQRSGKADWVGIRRPVEPSRAEPIGAYNSKAIYPSLIHLELAAPPSRQIITAWRRIPLSTPVLRPRLGTSNASLHLSSMSPTDAVRTDDSWPAGGAKHTYVVRLSIRRPIALLATPSARRSRLCVWLSLQQ